MRPRLAYRTLAVEGRGVDRLTLAGGAAFLIPGIDGHWGPVDAVTVALVTIGSEPEALVRAATARGDASAATLLDSAASAAVECLAEWLNDHLCQQGVPAGVRVTNRISPGVAGWLLAEQANLLAELPAAAIGVALDAEQGLVPAKTISLLVGHGRAARVDHYFPQCRRCWAERCPARRVPAVVTVDGGGLARPARRG